MGDQDRDAILARRALFMSAALMGLACTPRGSPEQPAPQPQPINTEPPVVVEPSPAVKPVQPTVGLRPSWSEVMANAPPLHVPEGLTHAETDMLENLASRERERYATLEAIWVLPSCRPSAADCEAWNQALATIDGATDNWGPLCGYAPETTHTYLQRQSAHARYVRELTELLLEDLDAAVIAGGDKADNEAWRDQRNIVAISPRPCLSCSAPTTEPVTSAIHFPLGEATLSTSRETEQALQFASSVHQQNKLHAKAKLIVRGHASTDEAEPELLSRQRAEAVMAALIKIGIKRKDIEVRSYAERLPITHDPAQAMANRRVDFEVYTP